MSTVKSNTLQLGQSLTATNNFTWYQPSSPDGTVRLGNGNAGSVTDLVTVNSSGNVGIGTSSPTGSLCVTGVSQGLGNNLATSNPTGGAFNFVDPNSATIVNTVRLGQDNGSSNGVTDVQIISYGSGDNQGGGNLRFINSRYSLETGLIKSSRQSTNTGYISFYTQGGSGLIERMRLDSAGNLGLGVTPSGWNSVYRAFDFGSLGGIASAANTVGIYTNVYVDSAFNSKYKTTNYATSYLQNSNGTGQHQWFIAPSGSAGGTISFTQAMTLDASGNLLVGTTSTSQSHKIIGLTAGAWATQLYSTWSTANQNYGLNIAYSAATPNGTGNDFLYCADNTTLRASFRSNGGLANYSANNVNLSDERVKTEITPAPSWLSKINAIEVVNFKYKDQTHDDFNLGAIAQQVQSVAPELVDTDGYGETPEDGVPLMAIYETDLKYAMLKAIQELSAELNELKAKVK